MVDASRQASAESRLASLRQAYRQRLEGELERIGSQVEDVRADPLNAVNLGTLRQALHKLAGSAGTFGFHRLGYQARRLEQRVADAAAAVSEGEASDRTVEAFDDWLGQLQSALRDDESGVGDLAVGSSASSSDVAPPQIWLVERDAMLSEYIAQQLVSFGFVVNQLERAEDLLARTQEQPDLLLVDHRASDDPAVEAQPTAFWQQMLSGYACPVVFTGAEEGFDVRLNAVRSGGWSYFAKPLDVPQLAARVANLLSVTQQAPERVLIVENDSDLAQFCVAVLERAGMQARWLDNPRELIDTAIEFAPELIVMDLWLPDVSGSELVAMLSQFDRWSQLPIVYLSAASSPELRGQALMRGGDAFLEKPVDEDLLVRVARSRVRRLREVEELISRDGLSGLLKHASIKEALADELKSARRDDTTVSFLMLDIDHFKAVNDTHGHAVGDLVISAVGTLLRQYFRTTDKLGRYGGEEFAVVLPNCTAQAAVRLAEGLRRAFSAIQFFGNEQRFSCTLSVGVTDTQACPEATAATLVDYADQALYRAKHHGRDRVCVGDRPAHAGSVSG